MRALVVYESMFGNTAAIADAVADGLRPQMDVTVANIDDMAPTALQDVDLLVVGAPTHAFGLSRPQTRKDAGSRSPDPLVTRSTGMREWLEVLVVPAGVRAAAFSTRVRKARWAPGSAAKGAAKRLRSRGLAITAQPADFYVEDTLGPLSKGEGERAAQWGASLAVACARA
jgi:hypothetical protein